MTHQEKLAQVKSHYGTNHPEYREAERSCSRSASELRNAQEVSLQHVKVEYQEAVNRETMLKKHLGTGDEGGFDKLNSASSSTIR